jgi:arsenate reductase
MKLHGIANCDTVRNARAWLDAHGVAYDWIDFRKAPPSADDLARWCKAVGWETLLNRRGTTWRGLDEATKAAVTDAQSALAVMLAHPTLIKRPVLETGHEVVVGYSADDYAARLRE